MSAKKVVFLTLCCALAAQAVDASPILTVAPSGISGGNRLWAVNISPDASLFGGSPPGGSLAVELAFSVDDPVDLLGVVNATPAIWDTATPGNNPFTNTITTGLYVNLINDQTFGAFGSTFLTSPSPVQLFTITTMGTGSTTLRYGTAASGTSAKGNIIAQAGQTFTYTGVVSVPEPATFALAIIGMACALVFCRRR
jgi:hypothetical protein